MPNARLLQRRSTLTALIAIALIAALPSPSRAQSSDAEFERINSALMNADKLQHEGKAEQAIALLKAEIARVKSGPESIMVLTSGLGKAYSAAGHNDQAEPALREAIKYWQDHPGSDMGLRLSTINALVEVLIQRDKFKEALPVAETSLKEIEAQYGPNHERTNHARDTLAKVYISSKRLKDAIRISRQALKSAEDSTKPDDPETIPVRLTLAAALMYDGKLPEAKALYEKSLAIADKRLGPNHEYTARARNGLANVKQLMGEVAEGGKGGEGSKPRPGALPAEEIDRLNTEALAARAAGQFEKAKELFEQALKLAREKRGPTHSQTAVILANLSGVYSALGRIGDAEGAILESLAINKENPGTVAEAKGKVTLAEIYARTGRYAAAKPLLEDAIKTVERELGPDHPDICTILVNLATLLAADGRVAEAIERFDRERRSRREYLLRTLPVLSEEDQLMLIESGERIALDGALTLAVENRSNMGTVTRSAEWVLNGKSLTARALASRSVLAREAKDPETAKLVAELDETRGRLALLYRPKDNPGGPSVSPSDKEYKATAERARYLEVQLGPTLKGTAAIDKWVELDKVRAALPSDAILIEFAQVRMMPFSLKNPKTGPDRIRYAAWVVPPAGLGETTLVDLGPSEAIEQAVSEALRVLQVGVGADRGPGGFRPDPTAPPAAAESAAETRAFVALRALADLIYEPLRAHLDPAKRWVISPDAALWLVPWAALPVDERTYAVERHLIHLAVSGRDLLAPGRTAKATKPAILADPDYDLAPGRASAVARKLLSDRASPSTAPPPRSLFRAGPLSGPIERLPNTRNEAEAIRPLMAAYAGTDPDVFLDDAASETVFKGLRGPKALVLSTHGFFLAGPKPVAAEWPPRPGVRPAAAAADNPLLRCGLILAGYNKRVLPPPDGETDDGLLTGLEVTAADLRGTELVVLSACETGLGQVRAGEGIAGLRQAFQLAGAGGVVASLWQVQDFESYQLMSAFFHGLSRRRGPAAALREAQLALIKDRRSRFGAAHPTFWAAFALTGFPGAAWSKEPLTPAGSADLPPLPRDLPAAAMISSAVNSPVTGRPVSGSPWPDAALAIVVLSGGSYAARRWWRPGSTGVS